MNRRDERNETKRQKKKELKRIHNFSTVWHAYRKRKTVHWLASYLIPWTQPNPWTSFIGLLQWHWRHLNLWRQWHQRVGCNIEVRRSQRPFHWWSSPRTYKLTITVDSGTAAVVVDIIGLDRKEIQVKQTQWTNDDGWVVERTDLNRPENRQTTQLLKYLSRLKAAAVVVVEKVCYFNRICMT